MKKEELKKILKTIFNKNRENKLFTFEVIQVYENKKYKNYIHFKAEQFLKSKLLFRINSVQNVIIILSLSMIAMESYDGDFWRYVRKQYNSLYQEKYTDYHIDNYIREIISQMLPKSVSPARKINYILWQSIVPMEYLNEFYNIILQVYLNSFRRSIPKDIKELEKILKSIFQRMYVDSENEQIKSSIMNQSYKFLQSTRDVINNPQYIESLVMFASYVLYSIDNKVKLGKNDLFQIPKFFSSWANEWYENLGKTKIKDFENKTRNKKNKPIHYDFNYVLEENRLFLNTKTLFVDSNNDYKNIHIEIYNEDKLIRKISNLKIIDNDLSYEIESEKIPVSFDPFNVTVKITGVNIQEDSIDCDYLLFDMEGRKINTTRSGEDFYILAKDLSQSNAEIIAKNKYYHVGYMDAMINDNIQIGEKKYSFKKYEVSTLEGHKETQGYYLYNEKRIDIYKDKVYIIHPRIKNHNKVVLWQNDKFIDINYDRQPQDIVIELKYLKIGFNHIELKTDQNKQIPNATWYFFYEPNLIVDLSESNKSLQIKDASFGSSTGSIDLDIFDKVSEPVVIEGKEFRFVYHPFVPMISIDDERYNIIDSYLWHSTFNYYSNICIKGIDADTMIINKNENVDLNKNVQAEISEFGIIFKFSAALLKIDNSKSKISLNFFKEGKPVETIIYLNRNYINENDVSVKYDDKNQKIFVEVSEILGKNSTMIHINENIFEIKDKSFKHEEKINETSVKCTVNIKDEDFVIYSKQFHFVSKREIIHKIFKINEVSVIYTNKISKGNYLINYHQRYINRIYLFIDNYDNDRQKYIGHIALKNYQQKYIPFREVNSVEIDFYQDIKTKDNIPVIIEIKDYNEALLFDMDKGYILDAIDEPKHIRLATIDEYILTLEENNET